MVYTELCTHYSYPLPCCCDVMCLVPSVSGDALYFNKYNCLHGTEQKVGGQDRKDPSVHGSAPATVRTWPVSGEYASGH